MSNGTEALTTNTIVRSWVEEMAALCLPDGIIWVDGSDAQRLDLVKDAVRDGEILPLDPDRYPNSFYHRTHPLDVARVEDKTFICCQRQQDAGATNNWKNPEEAYFEAANFFRGSMRGRTMYVVPFSMGPVS